MRTFRFFFSPFSRFVIYNEDIYVTYLILINEKIYEKCFKLMKVLETMSIKLYILMSKTVFFACFEKLKLIRMDPPPSLIFNETTFSRNFPQMAVNSLSAVWYFILFFFCYISSNYFLIKA